MKKVRILAIACAVIVAIGALVFMKSTGEEEVVTKNVVVMTMNVPQNTVITAEMLGIKAIPEEYVLAGAYTSTEGIIGKVSKVDLTAGEQLHASRLIDVGNRATSSLSMLIEEGMRAVTISVNPVKGVSNMIRPGDKIDVLLHYGIEVEETEEDQEQTQNEETEEPEVSEEMVTEVLMENITVLAVDNVMSTAGKAEGYETLTLMVTPEDANRIDWAEHQGTLRAALRTPLDEAVNEAPVVSKENISHYAEVEE